MTNITRIEAEAEAEAEGEGEETGVSEGIVHDYASAPCPPPPLPETPCLTVITYEQFRSHVSRAADDAILTFCPFTVRKKTRDEDDNNTAWITGGGGLR